MPRNSLCSTIASESTRYILNGLSALYYGSKKPFPHLPHYKSLTLPDMFLSQKAFESTGFSEEIAKITEIARQHPSQKCSVFIGGACGILILDPKDLEEILEKHADELVTKESISIFKHHFPRAVMSHSTGPWWRFLRNQVSGSVQQLKKDPHKIIQIAQDYVARLTKAQATEFDLKEIANSFTLEVLIRGFLGAENTTPEVRHRLAQMISRGVDEVVKFNNIAWLAVEETLPFYKPKLGSDKILKEAEEIIRKDILDCNAKTIWGNEKNWVNDRLSLESQGKAINPTYNAKDIVNDICFLLTAGSETTAKHFAFTFIEVIQNPHVLHKVMQEIATLGSPKTWTKETFTQTPYLDAVILESLRMHPPLPFRKVKVGNRFVTKDGTEFKPGDHIFINASATQRLEKHYKDPDQFIPERFLNTGTCNETKNDSLLNLEEIKLEHLTSQANSMKYYLQPFGMGPRSCPGAPLATLEVKVALACFVHSFDMKLNKNWDPKHVVTTFSARPEQVEPITITARSF